MENPHVRWRMDRAKEFAKQIAHYENVEALVIGGSVARGYADEFSDLEIILFWNTLPDDTIRFRIVEDLKGHFLFVYDGPSREDQLIIDGLQVDLWHISVSHQEAVIDHVLKHYASDMGSLNAMDTIRNAFPLSGEKLVQRWKNRAENYPQELAEKILDEHLDSFRVDYLTLSEDRKDLTGFYNQLSFLQQEAFLVLLALNKTYFPSYKWLYKSLHDMKIKPANAVERFRKAYEITRDIAISETREILEEIVQLVEHQIPHYDTEPIRRRLEYTRIPTLPPAA